VPKELLNKLPTPKYAPKEPDLTLGGFKSLLPFRDFLKQTLNPLPKNLALELVTSYETRIGQNLLSWRRFLKHTLQA
jgi:hypothetical protein